MSNPLAGKHILITGGSGFIGRALLPNLQSQGGLISVLTRDNQRAQQKNPTDVRWIEDLQSLPEQQPVDLLINLAGEGIADRRWSPQRKQLLHNSRIGTTNLLASYFRERDYAPSALVSASAIGFYGPHADELLDEQGPAHPSFSHDLCHAWEAAADQFEALGSRVCKVRIGIVLGHDGGALQKMLPPFRLGLGGSIGCGQQWMSWVHRQDLVNLLIYLLAHDTLNGVFNGSSPQPVRNQEFSQTLGRVLRRPTLLPMPEWLLQLLMGEMADELLLSGQRVYPQRLLESGFEFRHPQLNEALQAAIYDPD